MKKLITTLVIVLLVLPLFSQTYIVFESISVSPENPSENDSVILILSGQRTNTGAHIDTAYFEIINTILR